MATMQAVTITGHGDNEVVELQERPMPTRNRGEVLVRVKAAGLNRADLYMRDSGAGITHTLPQIMGLDASGNVADLDDEERRLTIGQPVVVHSAIGCNRCEFCQCGENILCTSVRIVGEHRDGTFADHVVVPAANVFPKPAPLDDVEAAALCVSYLTAWRMLFTKARLRPGETVLIFGIGGSVSLAALQLARLAGARAFVTSRDADKRARAETLGAEAAIDSATDIAKAVLARTGGRGVDVVFENVGEAIWPHALRSLVRGGRLVTCGATTGDAPSADLRRLFVRQLQIFGSTLGTFAEFQDLLALCATGALHPLVESRYPLANIHAALDRLESGRQFGKIGLTLAPD